MSWIIGLLARVVVIAFAVLGGRGGISAALLAAVIVGVIVLFGRTRRSRTWGGAAA